MRRLAFVGVLVAGLLAGAACGGKREPLGPAATVPRGTTTTNPYALPAVIDEAYVTRVLAGLDQAVGDVTRSILAAQTITNEAADRLESLYVGDALVLKMKGYQSDYFRHFAGYRENPGNKQTTVLELITVRPDCIFAKVDRDYSAVSFQPDPTLSTIWVALKPLDRTQDPMGYNAVGWVFSYDGFERGLSAPLDQCNE